jgi:hypothetical protein
VLRRIFGPQRAEVVKGWKKTYTEEPHNFYSSSDKIRMVKSTSMGQTRHVARMGERAREREKEFKQDFGGKIRRKEAIRKTYTYS